MSGNAQATNRPSAMKGYLSLAMLAVLFAVASYVGFAPSTALALEQGQLDVALLEPSSGYFKAHTSLIGNGAQIAAAQLNRKGGIGGTTKLKLTRVRVRSDASAAAVVDGQIKRGVDVLVLPCNTDSVRGLADAASKRGLLAFAPCDPDPTFARRFPGYVGVGMAGNVEAAQLARFANRETLTSAYVVGGTTSSYVRTLTKYFRAAAPLYGIKTVGASAVGNADDFSAIVRDIQRVRPPAEVIFTALPRPMVQKLQARLRATEIRTPIFATATMDTSARYPAALEQVTFASFGFPQPTGASFVRDYNVRFGTKPAGSYPGLGYETIHVLESAALAAKSASPGAIRRALERGLTVTGVALGDIVYPGKGQRTPVTNAGVVRVLFRVPEPQFSDTPPSIPKP